MKLQPIFCFLVVLSILQGCSGTDEDQSASPKIKTRGLEGTLVANPNLNPELSIESFSRTVYPLTQAHCGNCHKPDAVDSIQFPFHAHSDVTIAHDTALNSLNFANIPNSRLVEKLSNENHQCWSESCAADAAQMQAAIESWAEELIEYEKSLEEGPSLSEVATTDPVTFDRAASALVFKDTVHPLATEHCADCHRPNGKTLQQAPFHAHTDYTIAHDAVVDTARVNFNNIPNSRLVKRLREDEHYCWSECGANADEMQSAIETWSARINTSGVAEIKGARTGMLTINQADIRLPETINGTIVMQAESGTLSGRYKTKKDSKASNFEYVGADLPPEHPIEGTERTALTRNDLTGCNAPTAEDLQNTVNGPFRLEEPRRHVDQSGYRYYSQRIDVAIIRPHLRGEFRQAILNGENGVALERFFMSNDKPEDENNPDGKLRGRVIVSDAVRVLPEFKDKTFFDTRLMGSEKVAYRDFFAPRFGPSNSDFWISSHNEIRANLVDSLKRGVVYNKVISAYKNFFYRSNGELAKEKISDVPFTLRTLPDAEQTPYETNLTTAETFYNYYLGGLTQENALDIVEGMLRIDSYVYYFTNPEGRAFENFSQNHLLSDLVETRTDDFTLNHGNVTLDLANLYTGGDAKDIRSIQIDNYAERVKPVFLKYSCSQCHGDGSGRPQFAQNDNANAYDAAASIPNFFNITNLSQSRSVQRMLEDRHNCGGDENCDTIGNELMQAIEDWDLENAATQQAAQNNQDTGFSALSAQERTPGRASFKLNITEAGFYNVWLKIKTLADNSNSFLIRLLDSEGVPIEALGDGDNKDVSNSCKRYDHNTFGDWEWYTASVNDIEERVQWPLGIGQYTLEIIEREVGAELDMIAVSKNPAFNPAKNLVDESNIQSKDPKILSFDLSDHLNQPGNFEIEVQLKSAGDGYLFRNPRFVGVGGHIRFSDVKILVNNQYEFSNSTYTKLNRVVDGMDSGLLTPASLVALVSSDVNLDTFSFVFNDLSLTDQPLEALDDDAPSPVYGRQCQAIDLFAKTVMPVLNNFKLMMKEDYLEYAADDFPGMNGGNINRPTTYNCTTCHTEEHPYFKMTTFADGLQAGDPIPQEGLEALCEQALSRVDFGNYERSLLLRGLNGTFNHPKLHFIQKGNFSGRGSNRAFITSNTDPSGYASEFLGLRFEIWSENELNLQSYSGKDRKYLERFVGRYKQIDYEIYDNPFSYNEGIILTDNDVILNPGTRDEDVQINTGGRNLYTIATPASLLSAFNKLNNDQKRRELNSDPVKITRPWLVKAGCVDQNFNGEGGLLTDPCNNNVLVDTEFENVKQVYRESIINWMQVEKTLFDQLNSD